MTEQKSSDFYYFCAQWFLDRKQAGRFSRLFSSIQDHKIKIFRFFFTFDSAFKLSIKFLLFLQCLGIQKPSQIQNSLNQLCQSRSLIDFLVLAPGQFQKQLLLQAPLRLLKNSCRYYFSTARLQSHHILTALTPEPLKTSGSCSYGSGFDLKKVHILMCEQNIKVFVWIV